jgi:hypothetical protein
MAARKVNPLQVRIEEVVQHLRQIQSAVVVAVAALRHQGAERDEDIANVLQRSVVDKLEDQIEKAESVLRALGSRSRKPH